MSYTELKYFTIYCTVFAGIVSHLLLLVCLANDPLKCFRNSASYLVTNLAFADFIVCTVGLMRIIFAAKNGSVLCISNTVMLVSLFSIFSISIDRYMLTVHPFAHRVYLNGKRIALWITSIWLVSFCHFVKEITYGPSKVDAKIYNSIFIIVALLSGLIYLITYVTLRKQKKYFSQQSRCQNRALQQQFFKTIIIVALIQIFTIVPPSVGGLVNFFSRGGDSTVENGVFFQMYCLNFAINPFLYIWRLKNYRLTFCLVICRKAQ